MNATRNILGQAEFAPQHRDGWHVIPRAWIVDGRRFEIGGVPTDPLPHGIRRVDGSRMLDLHTGEIFEADTKW